MAARNMMRIPKRRKAHFDVQFKILDLNNVPLVAGQVFVKWQHLHTVFRGKTEKEGIREHKVVWNIGAESNAWISINRNGQLQESWLHFDVIQEYALENGKEERVDLGSVKVNLAQFVETCESEGEEVSQRYLLQNSKINSTLKLSIFLRQTKGDREFIAPPLKRVQAFNGISGILVTDNTNSKDSRGPQSQNTSKEAKQQADLYRKLLPARWTAPPGQLSAEQCIEHIFAGGDGWGQRIGSKYMPSRPTQVAPTSTFYNNDPFGKSGYSEAPNPEIGIQCPSTSSLSLDRPTGPIRPNSETHPSLASRSPRFLYPGDFPPSYGSRMGEDSTPRIQPSVLGLSPRLGSSDDSAAQLNYRGDAYGSDRSAPGPYHSSVFAQSRSRSPLLGSSFSSSHHPTLSMDQPGSIFRFNPPPSQDWAKATSSSGPIDDYTSSDELGFWNINAASLPTRPLTGVTDFVLRRSSPEK